MQLLSWELFCKFTYCHVHESQSVVSNSGTPMDYMVHGIFQARILEWIAFPFSRGSSQPRDRTQVSALQVDCLPAEPQEKPREALSQFSCSVMSDSLRSHGLQHARPPRPSPTPEIYPNSCALSGDVIQPSHPLSSPSPPALNLSQHQSLFQ